MPDVSQRSLTISILRALPVVAALLLASAHSAVAEPFRIENWKVTGRPLDAHAVESDGGTWLAVISVDGMPPNEKRYVTLGRLDGPAPRQVEIPLSVVAVDFEELDASPGPEILTIERERLRVLGVDGSVRSTIPLEPSLPLPPRTRQLSRLDVLGDWDGRGRIEVLLPDLDGLRLVPLAEPQAAHGLSVAVTHVSKGIGGGPPQRSFWISELSWPRVTLGDVDGDGRQELWASDRFGVAWFQRGSNGLEAEPSDRKRFPPFSFDEELRHTANLLRAMATDFDSDGRSDLLVVRTAGTVSASRTHAALHRNRGGAVDPNAPPEAELTVKGGFGLIEPVDLDGDGSAELLQLEVGFGVMQMIRIFTGGRADVRLRLHSVTPEGEGLKLHETWSETITVPFDTEKSRVGTLLPKTDGDWNGDGLLDLVYGDGDQLAIRLAERGPEGVSFSQVYEADVKPSEGGLARDLDGDGFSELVLFDPLDRKGRVRILRNGRTLPGSPPQIGPRD
jgi:hypothetical protein